MPKHPNAVELTAERKAHAKVFRNPDGTRSAEFSPGPIHYRATPGGPWLDKKRQFKVGAGTNEYISDESDVTMRTYETGAGGNRRWWVEFKETLSGQGIAFALNVQPTVLAGSNRLDFQGAEGTWSYYHTRMGGKMLSPNIAAPQGTKTYGPFSYQLLGGAPALTVENGEMVCGNIFRLPRPHLIGANGLNYAYSNWVHDAAAQTITFTYADTSLPAAAYPYKIDPSTTFGVAVSGDDQRNYKSDNSYTNPLGGGYVQDGTLEYTTIYRGVTGGVYYVINAMLRWETGSTISGGATVTGGTIRVVETANSSNSDGYYVGGDSYAWDTALNSNNFIDAQAGYSPAITARPISNFTTVGATYDFTLSSPNSDVAKGGTGYSSFRLFANRTGGATPIGENHLQIAALENTTYDEPKLLVDYATITYDETLRPTATSLVTNLTPTTDPSAYQTIDDDPDSSGTDFLTGTDPSAQTGVTNGPEYVDSVAGATGLTAITWAGGGGNVTDTSESTVDTYALAAANTDYGSYFSFNAADWTDIPSNATITGVSVTARMRGQTAGRLSAWLQLGTANGSLIGTEQALNGGATLPNTLSDYTVTSWGATPTRANLVTGTFGMRLRWRRGSQAVTGELASIKATITYDVPAATTNTEVRAVMGDPVGSLLTGTAYGEIRLQARKLGSGSPPAVTVEVREGTTLRATPINAASVTATATAGEVISGTFDQTGITDKNNINLYVVGTGAAGGLVEVGAVEWNSRTQVVPTDPFIVDPNIVRRMLMRR